MTRRTYSDQLGKRNPPKFNSRRVGAIRQHRGCPPMLAPYVVERNELTAPLIDALCELDWALDILKHERDAVADRSARFSMPSKMNEEAPGPVVPSEPSVHRYEEEQLMPNNTTDFHNAIEPFGWDDAPFPKEPYGDEYYGDELERVRERVSAETLANAQCWVAWRLVWDNKRPDAPPRKIPYDPRIGRWARVPTDPQTYSVREAAEARKDALACELVREGRQLPRPGAGCGIGLVLGQLDDGRYLLGTDLDSCRDDASGTIAPWAEQIIDRFDSYCEVSPSGTGVKLFFILSAANMKKLHALLGKDTKGKQLTREPSPPVSIARLRSTPPASTPGPIGGSSGHQSISVRSRSRMLRGSSTRRVPLIWCSRASS